MYQFAAKLATLAESGQSYKNVLYSSKNKKSIKTVYFLVTNAVKKKDIVDKLLTEVGLAKETKSNLWLSRVLVIELLWGRGRLPKTSPLLKCIADSKMKFLKLLPSVQEDNPEDYQEIPRYIRINTSTFTVESAVSFLEEKGFREISNPETYEEFLKLLKSLKKNEFVFDYHVPYLIVFNKKAKLHMLSPVNFIRQDKSSCLVSLLLSPLPGASILDMCAAPGYKTQHASSLIHKMGRIYSVDINKKRYQTLLKTCNDFKLDSCVQPLNMDALRTSETVCPNVEYLIVDPPCSGTGIVNILMKHTANEERLKKLSNLQAMILKHALTKFPHGRRLVYSTCSVEEAENEGVVQECLQTAEEEGWRLVPLRLAFRGSFSPGLGKLASYVLRLSPQHDMTNGFFIALFERSDPLKNVAVKQDAPVNTESTSISESNFVSTIKEDNILIFDSKKKLKTSLCKNKGQQNVSKAKTGSMKTTNVNNNYNANNFSNANVIKKNVNRNSTKHNSKIQFSSFGTKGKNDSIHSKKFKNNIFTVENVL